jgi:alkyl hydroperoxide reductase subunit AhpF
MSARNYIYDLIIIGGSAAATAAGIYAARRKLNFKIITKEFGGEVATSGEIDNWPGTPGTNGLELASSFRKHLEKYKVEVEEGVEVTSVEKRNDGFCISAKKDGGAEIALDKLKSLKTKTTYDYYAKAVIVATGVHPRELSIPGEKEFRGKGVTYCTTCDGPLFPNKIVATIGGGNSALESAVMMSEIAKEVYVLTIDPAFTGDAVLVDKINAAENVKTIFNADTREIKGDNFVNKLIYKDKEGQLNELDVEGIFVHIGMVPNNKMVGSEVGKNEIGEIKIDPKGQTSIPGLFAAGDVTSIPYKQIGVAVGQGIVAVLASIEYINKFVNTK